MESWVAISGDIIKRARRSRGRSQEALAEVVGADQTYISKIEKDKIQAGIKGDELLAIATFLEYDPYVFSGEIPLRDGDLRKREQLPEMSELLRRMEGVETVVREKIPAAAKEDPEYELLVQRRELREVIRKLSTWPVERVMQVIGYVEAKTEEWDVDREGGASERAG